jgi:hypothetical protein
MNKVHLLPKAKLSDVPGILRLMADEVERGDYGNVISGGIALRDDENTVHVFSCGDTNNDKAIAIFTRAIHYLVGI